MKSWRVSDTTCLALGILGFAFALPQPTASAAEPGGVYIPTAGYQRTVQVYRHRRAIRSLPVAMAPGLNLSLSGTRSIPVICVEFANRPHHFPTSDYQNLLFDPIGPRPSPPRPTLTQYYRDVSNNRFAPGGQVLGWYKLPENDEYYEGANNGLNEILSQLLKHAFCKADEEVDFGQFDNDGPDGRPNSGDDDGVVDTVFIVHSESGGECGNGNLRSHSFQYSRFNSTPGPFETKDIRKDEYGDPVLNADGSEAKIRIEDYTVQPALACPKPGETKTRIIPIGVFCHEYGHALGLPDLYDRTPAASPSSHGVGNYCLMSGGAYGADGEHAQTPVEMSAWCKALLGWADLKKITSNGVIPLEPVQQRNVVYSIDVPGTNGKEFFLIELRDPNWVDAFGERINWDQDFRPGGLAIWHVDESVGADSENWPFAPLDQGQNDDPSLPGASPPSFQSKRSMIALIQRDRKLQLERLTYNGETNDLYLTGESFTDDKECRAGSRAYSGKATGISIININLAATNKHALVKVDDYPPGETPAPAIPVSAAPPVSRPSLLDAAAPFNSNQVAEIRALQKIDAKISKAGIAELKADDQKRLSELPKAQLQLGISNQNWQSVLQLAAKKRTTAIGKNTNADTGIEKAVQAFLKESKNAQPATVRLDTKGSYVERITGLALPTKGRSPKEDAQKRVETQIRELIGASIDLEFDDTKTADEPIRYVQVVNVAGGRVPMHCNGIEFYYKGDTLQAFKSNVIPTDNLVITGRPGQLANAKAKQIVANALGLSPKVILKSHQCVFVPNGDSKKARIAVQVDVNVGANRKNLEVLVDSQTQKILRIE